MVQSLSDCSSQTSRAAARRAVRWALGALLAGPGVAIAAAQCPIPGEKIHWIADFCMAKLETDDEIAAGDCIGAELERAPRDACAAKRKYKRALCELSIKNGHLKPDVRACLADPAFAGSTVRNGGVGGR